MLHVPLLGFNKLMRESNYIALSGYMLYIWQRRDWTPHFFHGTIISMLSPFHNDLWSVFQNHQDFLWIIKGCKSTIQHHKYHALFSASVPAEFWMGLSFLPSISSTICNLLALVVSPFQQLYSKTMVSFQVHVFGYVCFCVHVWTLTYTHISSSHHVTFFIKLKLIFFSSPALSPGVPTVNSDPRLLLIDGSSSSYGPPKCSYTILTINEPESY